MEAKNKLHAVLVSAGFDEQKLRLDTVLEFLLAEEIFSLDDFEGAHIITITLNAGFVCHMLCRT